MADYALWVALVWVASIMAVALWRLSKFGIVRKFPLLLRAGHGLQLLRPQATTEHMRPPTPPGEPISLGKLDPEELRQQKEKFLKLIEAAQQQKGIPISIRDKLIAEWKQKGSDIDGRLKGASS